jgi:uncharacterized protein
MVAPGASPASVAAGRTRSHRPAQRMCVVCRAVRDKRMLVRVHQRAGGTVTVDPTGKGPGRGAYLCPRRACWLDAGLGRRLGHALRLAPGDIDLVPLRAYADSMPEEVRADQAGGDRHP